MIRYQARYPSAGMMPAMPCWVTTVTDEDDKLIWETRLSEKYERVMNTDFFLNKILRTWDRYLILETCMWELCRDITMENLKAIWTASARFNAIVVLYPRLINEPAMPDDYSIQNSKLTTGYWTREMEAKYFDEEKGKGKKRRQWQAAILKAVNTDETTGPHKNLRDVIYPTFHPNKPYDDYGDGVPTSHNDSVEVIPHWSFEVDWIELRKLVVKLNREATKEKTKEYDESKVARVKKTRHKKNYAWDRLVKHIQRQIPGGISSNRFDVLNIKNDDGSPNYVFGKTEVAKALLKHWGDSFGPMPDNIEAMERVLTNYARLWPPLTPPDKEALRVFMKQCHKSAVGPDGIDLVHWRQGGELCLTILGSVMENAIDPDETDEAPLSYSLARLVCPAKKNPMVIEGVGRVLTPDNTRPISVQNRSFRLCSGSSRDTIRSAARLMVDESQAGFLRSTIGNVIDADSFIRVMNAHKIKGGIFMSDIAKAFPSLSHKFMFTILKKSGAPPWVKQLFKNTFTKVWHQIEVDGIPMIGAKFYRSTTRQRIVCIRLYNLHRHPIDKYQGSTA
jgi:hypothetical protein